MKFSIIVPVYNVEKYLPQCIDSILNQDYVDFELILVNDGSPDNSLSICCQYAEKDRECSFFRDCCCLRCTSRSVPRMLSTLAHTVWSSLW